MKNNRVHEALVGSGEEHSNILDKKKLQKYFDRINFIFKQLPYKIYLIDADNYKVLSMNWSGAKRKVKKISYCYKLRYGLDQPCHLSGMACPLEIVKKTKKPTKIERYREDEKGRNWIAQVSAFPVINENNKIECVVLWVTDITAQKNIEKKLNEKEYVLRHMNNELFEMNQALATMAKSVETQRLYAEKRISGIISSKVLPIMVSAIEKSKKGVATDELNVIRMILNDLVQNVSTDKVLITDRLTHTELKVANLIKTGMSSEEVANHLFISIETVKTHRKSIRRKLGIKDSSVNLSSYINCEYSDGEICVKRQSKGGE